MNPVFLFAVLVSHASPGALPAGASETRIVLSEPGLFSGQDLLPSLFDDAAAVPRSLRHVLTGEIIQSLDDDAQSFLAEIEPAAGGGDGDGPIAALAFVLGVIPGFGIGHLVAGSIGGFIGWLIIDIVVGALLFYVFPILLFPTFGAVWPVMFIVLFVERLIEGYSAYRVAEYHEIFVRNDALPPDGAGPMAAMPNLLSLRF